MHEKNISHRDMSLENILVSRNQENWIAKLIDFGLSCRVQRNRQGEVELTDWEAAIGKTFYMSPEVNLPLFVLFSLYIPWGDQLTIGKKKRRKKILSDQFLFFHIFPHYNHVQLKQKRFFKNSFS